MKKIYVLLIIGLFSFNAFASASDFNSILRGYSKKEKDMIFNYVKNYINEELRSQYIIDYSSNFESEITRDSFCVSYRYERVCHNRQICRNVCTVAGGVIGARYGGRAGGAVGGAAAGGTIICHDVCENIPNCMTVPRCVQWRSGSLE